MAFTTFLWTFFGSFLLVKIDENHMASNDIHRYDDIPLDEISDGALDEPTQSDQSKSFSGFLELGGRELFFNSDARLLFFIISFIGGSGLMYINNIGSVLRALHEIGEIGNLPALQSSCVTILSVFNCGGRLMFALTSDRAALSKWRVRRSSYLLASALLAFLAHLSLAFSPASFIVICSAAQGLGYGMMYAVSTTITSMWFGTKNYGTNWGWMSAGPGLVGQLMSLVFGSLYDYEVVNKKATDEHVCTSGIKCYSLAFQIAASLCLMSVIITYALRSRRVKLHQ
ncbi:hypothetical protein DSO57_1010041 [Entomophthora muscae]|uniref:Uncharacterized protein n=1 Tax=Entomophthora muscae TaxID=34485 RepID=A0ACC2RXR6_9FUNG|nr:hypothetical protein DSO57_1010041 [Entomophthora muscae]